ncbi:VIT domain-containing protein [Planctomyces sp. SH-PL62]|uniref:VIT domain-containing protein n=1 Tax=Planctomyces sp. SH-PL62 TaxID=1636152 RepID=UPI00078BE0E5|nr:VIT domain-containing protein [Planctomyces sp. SH-PL62]AMV38221.1 von Willebrand factor type A domain protein [Planctomyces sp. SH-PL62]
MNAGMDLASKRLVAIALLMAAGMATGGTRAKAQGWIIDRRPTIPIRQTFEIREVAVDAKLRDQAAEVQVSQTFYNPGSSDLEAEYFFPIPEDAVVENLVLMVDGKELPGRLLGKDEARRIYEEIVRGKRDPALLEYMGRGLYRTSVFPIPAGAERKVLLRYTQLCRRDRDVVEFSYPLSTQKYASKPIRRLSVRVAITSKDSIKSVFCPSDDARIDRTGDHEVRVSLDRSDVETANDFRAVYTLAEGALGASVLSYRPSAGDDGYFLVLASPEVKAADSRPLPKTVVFVLDRSGSMAGKKIEQARKALKSVLDNLRDDDLFNIVVYDDRVETYKPELQRYSSEARAEAQRYVDNIREGGSTNIDAALKAALDLIREDSRPNYVLFLTDGLPTAGETNEFKIADACKKANVRKARVFSFGVGFDVNARLLDRLSAGNSGTSEYVKPDEDIEAHVARFYSKMTSPVLTGVRIEFADSDVNRAYPHDVPDLFDGGQIVWAGRYRRSGRTTLKVAGKVGGDSRSFEFPIELAESDRGSAHRFVERIWVVRRIGDLIDQIDLQGQNKELVDELVRLSTQYGIMTPYTSFLADERTPLHARTENAARAGEALSELSAVSGPSGVNQRSLKNFYREAQQVDSLALQDAARREGFGTAGGMAGSGMMGMMGGGRSAGRAQGGPSPPRPRPPPGSRRPRSWPAWAADLATRPRRRMRGRPSARWGRRRSTSRRAAGSTRTCGPRTRPPRRSSASSATTTSTSPAPSPPTGTST